jgi:hypothetical protein
MYDTDGPVTCAAHRPSPTAPVTSAHWPWPARCNFWPAVRVPSLSRLVSLLSYLYQKLTLLSSLLFSIPSKDKDEEGERAGCL